MGQVITEKVITPIFTRFEMREVSSEWDLNKEVWRLFS
jgi:hypothetical protein